MAGDLKRDRRVAGQQGHTLQRRHPPTPIQPTYPAGDVLGYPYTWGHLVTLAITRVFERNADPEAEGLELQTLQKSVNLWAAGFKDISGEDEWDQVVAEGPPEAPRPWG